MKNSCLRLLLASLSLGSLAGCQAANSLVRTAMSPVRLASRTLLGDADDSYIDKSPTKYDPAATDKKVEMMAFTTEEVVPNAE